MRQCSTFLHTAFSLLAGCLTQSALAIPPDPNPEAHALQRDGKNAEAAAKLETYLEHNRFDGQAWSDYGFALHADKQYEKGILAFEKAIALGFSPETNYYNIACANALLGRKDAAFAYLRKALEARFAEQETLRTDTDIDSLRTDPRFFELTGLNGPAPDGGGGLAREKQWATDLAFLQRRMEHMHWDLYAKVSKAAFSAEIAALTADSAKLTDGQMRARVMKLLALVGDGHTTLAGAREGEDKIPRYPVHMFLFSDGLYIIGAPAEQADLVGARVLSFGSVPTDKAVEAIRPYCSVDNAMGYSAKAPGMLANPFILQAIGAASDESAVELRVRTQAGPEKTARLTPAPYPARGHNNGGLVPGYTYVHTTLKSDPPLWLRDPSKRLRTEHLTDSKTLYCWFGAVQNDGDTKLGQFFKSMFEFIDKNDVENLVIDMRMNGGGNTGLVQPLIHGLIKCEKVNRPGHLFVIIGRHTFSAAQNTASMIEANTAATFVGEPTGSCPNFVGESTWFVLPYSQLRVHCSSRYWQNAFSTDRRTWVQPQSAAEMSFADYAANRDPCMDAILSSITKQPASH